MCVTLGDILEAVCAVMKEYGIELLSVELRVSGRTFVVCSQDFGVAVEIREGDGT